MVNKMADINMYDNVLKQAFHEYMEEQLESDIYREDEFSTSEKFEKKMEKMIKSEHNVYHKVTLTRARKILCVAAIIIALLLSSLSVEAVRNLIANFFVEYFNDHNTVASNTEGSLYPTELESIYELGYIPDGYKLLDEDLTSDNEVCIYVNGNGDSLVYEQNVKKNYSINIDNEYTTQSIEMHKKQEFYIYNYKNQEYNIIWDNGEYVFSVSGKLPKNELLKLCYSLKINPDKKISK